MKVEIHADELYPYYYVSQEPAYASERTFEVDDAVVARWKKAEKDFEAWQDEVELFYKNATNEAWRNKYIQQMNERNAAQPRPAF